MARSGKQARNSRDRRREQRRCELVEAAVAVIRREGPGISMEEIAAEAGVTKPILYRHFGDRSGLRAAVSEYAFERLVAGVNRALHQTDAAPRQVVADTIDCYLAFIESDPHIYRFLAQHAVSEPADLRETVDRFVDRVAKEVSVVLGEELRAIGTDSGPAEAWAYAIAGMVLMAGEWWLERRTMTRARLCAYLTELITSGIPGLERVSGSAHDELGDVLPMNPADPGQSSLRRVAKERS